MPPDTLPVVDLEYPLKGIVASCAKLCEPECCGRLAFHFLPVHMASHLLSGHSELDPLEVSRARFQLCELEARYSVEGFISNGVTILDIN